MIHSHNLTNRCRAHHVSITVPLTFDTGVLNPTMSLSITLLVVPEPEAHIIPVLPLPGDLRKTLPDTQQSVASAPILIDASLPFLQKFRETVMFLELMS